MKHLGGIEKPRLKARKGDRTRNDDDDKCHLADDET